MKNCNKVIVLSLSILISLLLINSQYRGKIQIDNRNNLEDSQRIDLERAGLWNLTGSPISIEGNNEWVTTAANNEWCRGSGTYGDPYIIEDVIINGQGSLFCISIRGTDVFFIIRNCILFNSRIGISLEDVYNGVILENSISQQSQTTSVGGIQLLGCESNEIAGNIIKDFTYGMTFQALSKDNSIYDNQISDCGIGIAILAPEPGYNNIFYRNFFLRNNYHAYDSWNFWNNSEIGNYWDDYTGMDLDRDGIGDIEYNLPGSAGVDYLPIFDDRKPLVSILSPSNGMTFGEYPPYFHISVEELYLDSTWYTLDNGLTNITFRGFSGIIEDILWAKIPNGPINITFYAKDKAGLEGFRKIYIIKNAPEPLLEVDITEQTFSTNDFNFTISIYNETGHGIINAEIQIWWNGNDVSDDVINVGNGWYFVSLEPITIAPGEDPILLNMTISAANYLDKYFETYIGVDPEVVSKEEFKYIFEGYGALRVEGKWYSGESKLFISDDLIKIEIGDQSASWEITKHYEGRNIEYYHGSGSQGKIRIIIHRGEDLSKALALGNGVHFYGTSTLVSPVSRNFNSLNLNDSRYVICFFSILMGLVGLIYRKKQVVHFKK